MGYDLLMSVNPPNSLTFLELKLAPSPRGKSIEGRFSFF